MTIYTTEFQGRKYEIVTNPENYHRPMHLYCEVYRTRKDGSRGMRLMSHRPEAYAVWKTVAQQADIDEGREPRK